MADTMTSTAEILFHSFFFFFFLNNRRLFSAKKKTLPFPFPNNQKKIFFFQSPPLFPSFPYLSDPSPHFFLFHLTTTEKPARVVGVENGFLNTRCAYQRAKAKKNERRVEDA